VKNMDAVVVAVAHKKFVSLSKNDIIGFFNSNCDKKVLMDLKGIFNKKEYLKEDFLYWSL